MSYRLHRPPENLTLALCAAMTLIAIVLRLTGAP